tara:strand:+ start:224 stop:697 length:474 start_codon:yes stop_codon:yes gene_type:complete
MGVYSYALKGLKAGATKLAQKLSGQNKTKFTGKAINTTKPGTKLTFKRGEQDKFVKFRDNLYKSAGFDTATKNKLKSKQPLTKINKGKSDIFTPKEPKFSKGGRVGLKRGTFPDHSGDGKITQKDILMAKGVIPKTKKKTMMAKKSKSPMDKAVRKA